MAIIIKGIDLPKETKEVCVMYKDKEGYLQTYIVKDIIQVPKGARLIDANALFKDLREQQIPFDNDINSAINVAPTILESEEE